MTGQTEASLAGKRPPNPFAVLAAAVVLPGSGHLWLGANKRALGFLFFILVLGWVTSMAAPPEASFVGRHAGGFLVYALSLLDAYRLARVRFEEWRARRQG